MNYELVYNKITFDLKKYVEKYNLRSLILGISGGIDSTVCAALCRTVCDELNIPLIGRSLPIKNKEDEFDVSKLVGEAFCNDFKVSSLKHQFNEVLQDISKNENSYEQTLIANGNIQARLRMIYLYNLASIYNGIVIDTDNFTENNLGFFTIHGDQGDYKPIVGLWKTEVYELANWILENKCEKDSNKYKALSESIKLTPTDGLGISNSDLEQLGAKNYKDVDEILRLYIKFPPDNIQEALTSLKNKFGEKTVNKIIERHEKSKFKRLPTPGTYCFK